MEEWFYTDAAYTQQGPVECHTLLDLNKDGTINAASLVWNEKMSDWQAFSTVAAPLFGESEDGIPIEIGVCAYSNRVYPGSEMMPYGDALIGIEHKDAFVQRLMESGETGVIDATTSNLLYIGFWWRVLASVLDFLILIVPFYLCIAPFYVLAVSNETQSKGSPTSFEEFPAMMLLALFLGALGFLGLVIFYETWMVGKYGGTVGKLAINAKVVNPDGSKLTYFRAFVRWLAKFPLNQIIIFVPSTIAMFVSIFIGVEVMINNNNDALGIGMILIGYLAYFLVALLFSGVFWMCAFDMEKRTLHDRVSSTRVVRK